MNAADAIKSILSEQVSGYRDLLDILQRERACLIHFDPRGVETLSKEKDTTVMKLRLLEQERARLVRAIGAEQGVSEDRVFRRLAEATGDETFPRVRLQLISLLQSITELNGFNRVLIERSAAVVKNALNFLGSCGVAAAGNGSRLSREV